uniref:Ig-like domain-containing protein n=1 Tax=Oryzias latipes TaxID=8090 RepID=A0A3P9ME21_ORYLA
MHHISRLTDGDTISPEQDQLTGTEGKSVTMKCNYQTDYGNLWLHWYKHESDLQAPQFILWKGAKGTPISQPVPGFSFKVSDDQRQMDLQISSAAVTDSAVYYCAVTPTVTGNNKTLYKKLQQHNTTKYPLEGVTDCERLTDGDTISPEQDQLTGTEGKSVTMKCNYQTDYGNLWLHWYKHESDLQAPQFILWKGAKGYTSEHIPDKRYESRTTDTSTELTITKLTLADSALYYCALERAQ